MKLNQKIIIPLLMGLVTLGCVEDEITLEPIPTAINFDQQTTNLALGQEPVKIKINLEQPASKSGSIGVKLTGDATYGEEYETLPATDDKVLNLQINEGEEYIELSVLPKEEGKFDGEKTVLLKLETVSQGFSIGTMSQASIILRDEILGGEAKPVKVAFTSSTLELQENQAEGAEVKITLDGSVKPGCFIKIKLVTELGAYGSRFSVDPNPIDEEIRLYPQPGDSEITFKIRPINDYQVIGDLTIQMSISQIGNHMEIGEENELLLTIKEDDLAEIPETHTIAELREKFLVAGDWYLPQDYFIQGIITSHENLTQNAVYIQDETAGILIRFTGSNLLKRGDHVRLNLKSGELKNINGQETIVNVNDRVGIKLGENKFVEPETLTIEQLKTGLYRGKLVRVEDVFFPEANGILTFENTRRISDGTNQSLLQTYPWASFHDKKLPAGKLHVTGIVGDHNRLLPQVFQEDIVVL